MSLAQAIVRDELSADGQAMQSKTTWTTGDHISRESEAKRNIEKTDDVVRNKA